MKLFKRNPQPKGKASAAGKQGIFAIAFLTVAVVGMIVAVTYDAGKTPAEIKATATPAKQAGVNTPGLTPNPLPTNPAPTEKPVSGDVSETTSLHKPVNAAKVSRGHTVETLVYSETLNEWAVHVGVDIPAAEGTDVFCVLDGTIESMEADPLTGNTVVISHAGKMKSVYKGLKDMASLKTGDAVKKGSVIGTVGNTNLLEVADGAHLHFEIHVDGVPVDPMTYLSGLSK